MELRGKKISVSCRDPEGHQCADVAEHRGADIVRELFGVLVRETEMGGELSRLR